MNSDKSDTKVQQNGSSEAFHTTECSSVNHPKDDQIIKTELVPSSPDCQCSSSKSAHVGFSPDSGDGYPIEPMEERKEAARFLTAKYPKQQMGMIRKRIAVEDWIDERLPSILKQNSDDDDDVFLDLDEILDISDEKERADFIKEKLPQALNADSSVNTFVEELITKLRAL